LPQPEAAAFSGQTWRNEMASFFTFDRTISTIAREFKPNALFGNAFSEVFSEKIFDWSFRPALIANQSRVRALRCEK
jgi:hypothetical protein